jgi:putative transposase
MSQRAATIESLPVAFEVVKAMQADGLEWSEGFRPLGRQAIAEIIEQQMAKAIDVYLDQLDGDDIADRRNGYYRRHLLTELGDIELSVPRTRHYSPVEVVRAYARRTPELDRVILSAFVLGLSTRKVGETLLSILGRPVSPTTVSQVAKTLDGAVAAFHRRPLADRYKALMLDGVVLARKTGAGALRRPVLVALGLRHDDKKEIIDFHLAGSESTAEWERFLTDLYRRGLTGEGLDMICVDGGSGLLAALPAVLPDIPIQRCWAHKIRNVLDKVRKTDQPKVKRALHKIMNAANGPAARSAARRFAERFAGQYPSAVACLRNDLDELLTCFHYKSEAQRRAVRTTNAVERRFREVRRRTRPMGTFQDKTSMDRILFAVFTHENKSQGVSTPFLLTQNN